MRLSELTTLRIGGEVKNLVRAENEQQLIDAVREVDAAGTELLVLGGGSNLVASDRPFAGTVVHVIDPGTDDATAPAPDEATCGGVTVDHFAGVPWDRAVRDAVARELIGIEALSGIPGSVGATPIQNVGAYGQEVAQTISRVRTWDRHDGVVRTFAAADCRFAYRDSLFKRTPYEGPVPSATGRYVVLSVTFQHPQGSLSAPIRYAELARRLGVEVGERAPLQQVRDTVLAIRGGKGMVLDAEDHDTWSAGSFFTNPLLSPEDAARLPEDAPRFPAGDLVKTSAAWLISQAGFDRGFGVGPRAALSSKHSLALTNRGDASSEDIVALAAAVRAGVQERFGVHLEVEPVRLGLDL
ncbi:MAG: UDP-N-acetylmuramate dehydrogenase [Brachybacterium sp.]|nr:UDP-N-acetylmuramate dehydrogenase [Brachybacterium sp.]